MKKVNEEELNNIKTFENACNDFMQSKFILFGVKIQNVLSAIAKSKAIFQFLAECLLNFDYEKSFKKATGQNRTIKQFVLPEDRYEKVALVFCLLINIDDNKLNFYDFIKDNFVNDTQEGFSMFCQNVFKPFRDEILNNFALNEINVINNKENIEQIENISIYEEIAMQLRAIKNLIDINTKINIKKKQELNLYLDGLIVAMNYKNLKIITAIANALDESIRKIKPLNASYDKLTNLLIKLY